MNLNIVPLPEKANLKGKNASFYQVDQVCYLVGEALRNFKKISDIDPNTSRDPQKTLIRSPP